MSRVSKTRSPNQIQEITERIERSLNMLRNEKSMTVQRARAIAKVSSSIIDTVKLEAKFSATNREKQ